MAAEKEEEHGSDTCDCCSRVQKGKVRGKSGYDGVPSKRSDMRSCAMHLLDLAMAISKTWSGLRQSKKEKHLSLKSQNTAINKAGI